MTRSQSKYLLDALLELKRKGPVYQDLGICSNLDAVVPQMNGLYT